jgi:hypothetical protein
LESDNTTQEFNIRKETFLGHLDIGKNVEIKMTAFWDVVQCSLVEIDVSEVHTASITRTYSEYMDIFIDSLDGRNLTF